MGDAAASDSACAVRFSVSGWSAWAPGLTEASAWRDWATAPFLPSGPERPELAAFPPLLRRRAERLARMALHTTGQLRSAAAAPMIFASARGEVGRGVQLLQELAREGRVSPGPFSLSVHNAVAALDSIAHADSSNYSAIAAGAETAEAAIIEACALLGDGHTQVLVTVYDDHLPEIYRAYASEPDAPFAWSWWVTAAGSGPAFELRWSALDCVAAPQRSTPASHPGAAALPHALDVLRYYLTDDASLTHDGPHHRWTWRRTA